MLLCQKIGKDAHEREIRAEQLIIIFKQLWNSLAESLRPQNADQYERTGQLLVTLCIQAYQED